MVDLVIRGGRVVDGTGCDPYEADVAISAGRIIAVGNVAENGRNEIDAKGLIVTPGFVDIHTHYDGQATWENTTAPSANHGVTSVVMGNCGVGFAPCRPQDREQLIRLMEGVEDIPEAVMTDGLPWDWETFPEYLDALDRRQGDVDIATQLPHSCLRVYVMGQRGLDREAATEDDRRQMTALAREAMLAGALGFSTSRTIFHRNRDGEPIPSKDVAEEELHAIALGLKQANRGVLQVLVDFDQMDENFGLLRRIAHQSGRPLSFTLSQTLDYPDEWRTGLALLSQANREGVPIKAQVIGRPTGLLLGLDLSFNPFSLHPGFQAIKDLPLADKVKILRQPDMRRRLLSEAPGEPPNPLLKFLQRFDAMYPLGDPPDYMPAAEKSLVNQAHKRGMRPEELAYELMLEDEGRQVLFIIVANYVDSSLTAAREMLTNEHTLLGLGDGGAHYGLICDAGFPSFMLSYWTRDRADGKLGLPDVVRRLSSDPANAVGLADRGVIAPGYKADLNVIDYQNLTLRAPRAVYDLPGGGRRLSQAADGYVATVVSGELTYQNGLATGARPGRLIRGPQAAPGVH